MKEIGIVVKLLDRFSGELKKGARTAQDSFKAMQNSARTAGTAMNRASGDARKSLVNVQNETRKASNALTKLGRTATSLKLTPNTDGLRKVSAEATRAGGTITQSFTRAATTSSTAMNHLSTTTTTAAARAAGSMQRISTAASSALGRVSTLATSAGTRLIGAFSRAATSISGAFSRVGSAASSAFSRIRKGVSGASASLDTLSSNISGLIGAFGAAQLASESFSAAMERDMFTAYMEMNVGAAKAREFASIIRQINIESPAPGGFINKLITGAIANQASLTASELRLLGQVASDYYMASMMMGKNKIDVEQDLITYINTGNTAEMARTSILKDHVDYLGQQKTISERILALDKALKEEGYRGLSQQQRALIYWELTKDLIMEVFTSLAGSVLPVLAGVMRAFVSLNEATHGWAAALVAGGVGLLVFITALPTLVSLVETVSIGFSLLRGVLVALPGLFAGAAGGAGLLGSAIAFLTGPLGVALIAVTAITAAFIYFYRTNESFRESVDRLGRSIMSVLGGAFRWLAGVAGQVFSVLGRGFQGLLTVFSPVLGVMVAGLTSLGSALQGLWGALQPVVSAVGGFLSWLGRLIVSFYTTTEGVRSLISALGPLGVWISFLINPLQTLRFIFEQLRMAWDQWVQSAEGQAVLGQLRAAFNDLGVALNQLWGALQPVFQALSDAWAELSKAINPAREAGNAVKGVGSGASQASGPLQIFVEIIRIVGWILTNVVVPAIRILAEWIHYLVPVFQAIGFAISAVIQVMVFIGQVVWNVITFLTKFGQALQMLISGHITFSQFMSIVWNLFKATVGRILLEVVLAVGRFGAQLIGKAVAAALGFVNSFLSFIRSLPGRLWIMLLIVVQRIIAWANKLREMARQAASTFVSKFVGGVTGLPGRVSKVMWDVVNAIKNKVNDAYNAAKEFGQNVWNGIKSALHIKSPSIIYKQIESDTALVNQRFRSMASSARAAASTYAKGIREGMDVAGANVPIDATIKASPVAGAVDETRKAITDMHGVTRSGLTSIVNTWSGIKETTQKTRDSYNASVNITRNAMTTMSTTTKTTMTHIKTGFNSMKSEVVSAASRTKTGVTGHLNTLSSNIRRFYNLVMNPGAGGPAGPGPSRRVFTTPSLTRLGAGGPPRALTPTAPLTGPEAYTVRGARRLQKIAEEYYRMLSCPSCYGAGWDYSTRMTGWVNRAVDKYRVGWLPGITLRAGDFSTYPPRGLAGNLAKFIPFISSVIGRTHYRFYYGDSGLSPAELLRAGAFNCYDGARLVVAFARAFGLPASIRCGLSWGGIPHCAANVAGMWFDTTAFQQGYGWRSPRVTGYGGPTSSAEIERLFKPKETTRTVDVNLRHDLSFNIEVKASGSVSKETVTQALKEAEIPDKVKRNLLEDELFRSRLLKVIGDAISREKRAYGI